MKRVLVVAIAGAVLAAAHGVPAEARKRKPRKPSALTFFLRNETQNCEPGDLQLRLTDGSDMTNCGSVYAGPVNAALVAAGHDPQGTTYSAVEGLPLRLDTGVDVKGTVGVRSLCCGQADAGLTAGPTSLVVTVSGMSEGREVTIGSTTIDYMVVPPQRTHIISFSFAPDPQLNGARLDELALKLYNVGAAPFHGFYTTDDPGSTLELGVNPNL